MIKTKRCIFLDRDGTLIDTPETKSLKPKSFNNLNQVHLKKDVIEVCSHLKKNYMLMLFTNQPDVTLFLKKRLSLDNILVNYSDDEKNYFRKPNPGMLFYAKKIFDIDLKRSYVVGDRWRDIDAGSAAECKTIFIDRNYNEKLNCKPDFIVKNIKQILKFIK